MLFGGYEIRQPAFRGWEGSAASGTLFPFLFVTIACGACSGFHGLVCSGTTSKQVERESHTRFVGYGAMLAEAFVGVIALVTVLIFPPEALAGMKPGTIYGNGIGEFLTLLIGPERRAFAVTFGAMAFSTFVFDTLDVATRLGRYIVQELFGWTGVAGAITGTLLTVALPLFLVLGAEQGSYLRFWTLFGASNQLLAALTLIAVAAWLHQEGKPKAFVVAPMLFVAAITVWALARLAWTSASAAQGFDVAAANAAAAIALLLLALYLLGSGLRRLRAPAPKLATSARG
jgi:carbon starvation protein